MPLPGVDIQYCNKLALLGLKPWARHSCPSGAAPSKPMSGAKHIPPQRLSTDLKPSVTSVRALSISEVNSV
jgi:hypothetical protein